MAKKYFTGIPAQDEVRIVELFKKGISMNEISRQTGHSGYKISKLLQREGLWERRKHAARVDAAIEAEAIALYNQGHSISKIAEMMGRSISGVHLLLVRAGVHESDGKPALVLKDEAQRMVELREQGLSFNEIAAKTGRSFSGVSLVLVREGIHTPSTAPARLPVEQKEKAVELYKTGISCTRVASIFGVDKSTILEWLEGGERHHQKKNCNHFAFHPDEHGAYTPAQKYWAGVLLADGCVMRGRRTPSVKLAMIDQEHVLKFKRFLDAEHDVCQEGPRTFKFSGKKYTGKPMYSIRVTSKQMAADLRRLGISQRKTYGASCPDFLKFDRDFWRGIADGDGWLSFDAKTSRPEVGVCGTPELCQAFAECINHICGGRDISARWQVGKGLLFSRARASGEKANTMAEWLYKDSVVSLDRKMLKARRMYEAAPVFTQIELML